MGTRGWGGDASRRSRHLLLLLAASLSLPTAYGLDSLKCLCDFNATISCRWDSSLSTQYSHITAATSCKLKTAKIFLKPRFPNAFKTECDLRPLDPTNPDLRACSLVLPSSQREVFHGRDTWNISLDCESVYTSIVYKPAAHIKLKPPSRPEVNLTIVSLFSEVPRLSRIDQREIQLQWKQEGQPWENGILMNETDKCQPRCQVELDGLEQGGKYQARSRVQPKEKQYNSVWSNWSPVLTWVSAVGTKKSPDPEREFGMQSEALVTAVVGAIVVLSLAIIVCKTDRDTWVYMVKKIRGPPLPNLDHLLWPDGKSQVWLNSSFNSESHHTLTGLDVISSVEVTNTATLNLKASSSYSNPSYPPLLLHVRALSSLPSLPQGNLKPCSADSPHRPMGRGAVGEEAMGESEENQREGGEERAPWDPDLLNMISGPQIGTTDSMKVCEEYEKVGEGGGSPADDDGPQGPESPEEEGEESQIDKLLSQGVALGDIIGQGSLEVCLGYEKFKLFEARAQSPDSGVGSGGEEQVSEESLEEVDFSLGTKTFTYPPLFDTELCLPSSLIQSFSFFPGQGTSSSLSFSSEDGASLTSSSTLLPSSGGYMLL